jgi:hypothetical protein
LKKIEKLVEENCEKLLADYISWHGH